MDLSRISVEARVRRPWEAIDLGFVLARQWWKPLFLSWLIPSFTLFLLLSVVFYQHAWVAPFVVWWCKPFWDRAPLYIASRALFGEEIGVRETLKALFSLYKTDWLAWLCWRRLSLNRAFEMPVTVLENLQGKQRQSRLTILHPRNSNASRWLTIICTHLEALFTIGVISMVFIMLPEQARSDAWGLILTPEGLIEQAWSLLSYSAMALIAPFYTVAGFALYISRRIDLEAWDIEIKFRHLAASQPCTGGKTPLLLCFVLALSISGLTLQPSYAEQAGATIHHTANLSTTKSTDHVDPRQQSKDLINDILAGDDFHQRIRFNKWRLKGRQAETPGIQPLPEWVIAIIEFFERHASIMGAIRGLFKHLAKGLEVLLWVVVVLLFSYFFYRYRDSLQRFIRAEKKVARQPHTPDVLFGLDVTQASLPKDVPDQVRALWQAEQYRPALSLLYRATLSSLMHQYDFVFSDEHTEGECASIVSLRGDPKLSAYTQQLTYFWQQVAYAHRLPESAQVDVMCQQWWEIFPHES
ncbi:MAG: DUF4129 domain-containing protein [bacterium]|nr:DUF4129 domain-containing protein [bacterium]